MKDFTISKASLCAFSVWLCRSLESSSLLLHFSGCWQYLFLRDGWYCASQANRSTPLILVNRWSSCFSCAILCPATLHFNFLSPFLFTKYTVWSEYYFVRIKRPTASTFKITTACNGWWRCWQATKVHCELLVAIPVITQSLRKSRWDLDTDIRHSKSFCCAFKTSPLYV
jgi:hypothetical protein